MAVTLTGEERSRPRGRIRRPRSRKQYYLARARALLALDEGQPLEAVAGTAEVEVERAEALADGFQRLQFAYLAETDGLWPKVGQEDERARYGSIRAQWGRVAGIGRHHVLAPTAWVNPPSRSRSLTGSATPTTGAGGGVAATDKDPGPAGRVGSGRR
jgi:hypothetical protein